MHKPYFRRPLPAYMYGFAALRAHHFFTFWALCNEFEEDDSGLIYIDRKLMNGVVGRLMDSKLSGVNVTALLKTLDEIKAVEILQTIMADRCSVNAKAFVVRINSEVWDWPCMTETEARKHRAKLRGQNYIARKRGLYPRYRTA